MKAFFGHLQSPKRVIRDHQNESEWNIEMLTDSEIDLPENDGTEPISSRPDDSPALPTLT